MSTHISIDFGTSNSTVCWTNPRTGLPEVIKDDNGNEKIPSVVYWGEGGELLVGEAAISRLSDASGEPEPGRSDTMQRLIKSVKRDLRHNQPRVLPDGRILKPVDTVAAILGHLKHIAESAAFHEPVDSVVLTHPVMMTQREKAMLEEAARKAGFSHVSFKEEPVSAAHGYLANGAKVGDGILIFDLGGGTLDLAYLQKAKDGSYRMPVECMGDVQCGGDDFDQVVYDHFEAQLEEEAGCGFSGDSGSINPFVLLECRKAKEKLTSLQTARMSYVCQKNGQIVQPTFIIRRSELEALSAPFLERATQLTGQMLKKLESSGLKLDTVLLIGGATRMPAVREALVKILPVEPLKTMYADVAVAMGGVAKSELKIGDVKTIQLPGNVPLELVWIAPGTFTMGSPKSELGRYDDETQHRVTLTKGYWLGKYPVTQGQYEALMEENPSYYPESGASAPVEQVSWDDAQEFCRKLTEKERSAGRLPAGYEYTLPTEAQWEYACRAGTSSALNNGKKLTSTDGQCCNLDEVAWYDKNSSHETHSVGQKQPNAWGLYDMHGNVWEWCADWYGSYPSGTVTDPTGAPSGSHRVARGGCWYGNARYCRSAFRYCGVPGCRCNLLGFRLALSSV